MFILKYSFLVFLFLFAPHLTLALEQSDKSIVNTSVKIPSEPYYAVQNISCEDLSGVIEKITFAIHTDPNSEIVGRVITYRAVVLNTQNPSNKRYSNKLSGISGQHEYTFTFNPIDVASDLCQGGGDVLIGVGVPTYAYLRGFLMGSASHDAYRDANYKFGDAFEVKDLFFRINPTEIINTAPELDVPPYIYRGYENEVIQFNLTAVDINADKLTYVIENLPSGANLDSSSGSFSWKPNYDQAGVYELHASVIDNGSPQMSDMMNVLVIVDNVDLSNNPPIFETVGNQTVDEGDLLTFTLSATDPDGDTLTYSAANLPSGASFDPNTKTFTWSPSYSQSGNYDNIEFTVTDSGSPMELDVELITITVGDVNRAPQISNPGPQEVLEAATLSFSVSAIDPDGDDVTLTASNLPAGATFNNGAFNWTPTLTQEGVYTVSFIATDTGTPNESSVTDVVITVGDNPTPTEQAEDLIDTVVTIDSPQNVENSYLANLQKVKQFILDGKIQAALNQLQAFINKVNQDYQQGILSQEEKESLIDAANELMGDLSN